MKQTVFFQTPFVAFSTVVFLFIVIDFLRDNLFLRFSHNTAVTVQSKETMKYLDLASFVPVTEWLASMECAGHVISGRLEAYSCKKTSSDRKLYKSVQMSGSFSTSEEAASMGSSGLGIVMQTSEPTLTAAGSLSPPQPAQPAPKDTMLAEPAAAASAQPATGLASPRAPLFGTGPLVGGTLASDENNTFVHLIATLNAALPDYDFSSAQSEHFTRVTVYELVNHVKTALEGAQHCDAPVALADLWAVLEQEVQLQQCEAFTYLPPPDSDPFLEDGAIWAMNYLMYNRNIKRIVLLTLSCERPSLATSISPSATPSLPSSIASRPAPLDSPTPSMDDQPFGFRSISADSNSCCGAHSGVGGGNCDDDDDDAMDE